MREGQQEDQVGLTLDRLHANHPHAANPSLEAYFSCFTSSARFLGTQEEDNWDMSEYRAYLEPMYDSDVRVLPVVPQKPRKVRVFGDFATFDEVLLGHDVKGELRSELRGTGTMVYQRSEDTWKIVLYHLSVPVPNEAALSVLPLLQRPHPFQEQLDSQTIAMSSQVNSSDIDAEALVSSSTSTNKKKKKKKSKK